MQLHNSTPKLFSKRQDEKGGQHIEQKACMGELYVLCARHVFNSIFQVTDERIEQQHPTDIKPNMGISA